MMTEQEIKDVQRKYNDAMEGAEDIILDAMEIIYRKLTGMSFNENMREKIRDAIRYRM